MSLVWQKAREKLVAKLYPPANHASRSYEPLSSQFPRFDDVLPAEQELICDQDMRMLLMGYQSMNIRIVLGEDGNPRLLDVNPSLDPYIRAAIGRFSDVVFDLYTIRKAMEQYASALCPSSTAMAIFDSIRERVKHLIFPIVQDEQENVLDSDYGLNFLFTRVRLVKDSLRCYAKLVHVIYEKKLCGGQIVDILDQELEKCLSFNKRDLESLRKVAWQTFLSTCSRWICRGALEDAFYEFFIWHAKDVSGIAQKTIAHSHPESLRQSADYLVVPDLCPACVKPYMAHILRLGLYNELASGSGQSQNATSIATWDALDTTQFIRMVVAVEKHVSLEILQELKSRCSLDESIEILHSVLLLKPPSSDVYHALEKNSLLDTPFTGKVSRRTMDLLSSTIFRAYSRTIPLLGCFKFEISDVSVFDEIRISRSAEQDIGNDTHLLYDHLSLSITLSTELVKVLPMDVLRKFITIFRIQMRLTIATQRICTWRNSLDRSGARSLELRPVLALISRLSQHVFEYQVEFNTVIRHEVLSYTKKYPKMQSIDALTDLQSDLSHRIGEKLLSAQMTNVLEDLLVLVDSFANGNVSYDVLTEEFNEWLERHEALQCDRIDSMVS